MEAWCAVPLKILLFVDLPRRWIGLLSSKALQGPPRSSCSWVREGIGLVPPWSPLGPAALLASRATTAAVQGPAPPFIKTAATNDSQDSEPLWLPSAQEIHYPADFVILKSKLISLFFRLIPITNPISAKPSPI